MKVERLEPRFVDEFPEPLDDGVLYVSLTYASAAHACACGCGREVITPLSPTGWKLIFDGLVSLQPSIGNWSFPCRSHYWVKRGRIEWSYDMSPDEVAELKSRQARGRQPTSMGIHSPTQTNGPRQTKPTWWERAVEWLKD